MYHDWARRELQAAPKRPTQAERAELSETRMVEAAINLIVRHGVAGMTLKEVGEAAGYSRGLAGARFGSKEGLIHHIIRSIGDRWLSALKPVTRDKSGLSAVCAAIDAHYRFCVEAPNHLLAFYILWFESVSPGSNSKETMSGIQSRRQRDVALWIKQGIEQGTVNPSTDVERISEHFCSALIGIVYYWLVKPDAMDEVQRLHDGLKYVMTCLLSPEHPQGIQGEFGN